MLEINGISALLQDHRGLARRLHGDRADMPDLFDALKDLAELALGCTDCRLVPSRHSEATGGAGARRGGLVYLSSGSTALHVGVLAAPADCDELAKRLLGKRGEALGEQCVRGAMCELAYLLAGAVRRRLLGSGEVAVGLPCFLEGRVQAHPGWQVQSSDVALDGIRATLVCIKRYDAAVA
jgi:hypothetical protein